MGGGLPDNDEWTLSLLTNKEVLDVLKLGRNPRQIYRNSEQAIWASSAGKGAVNLALFNLGETPRIIHCPLRLLSIDRAELRDLWAGLDRDRVVGEITAELVPHGAALFRVSPQNKG